MATTASLDHNLNKEYEQGNSSTHNNVATNGNVSESNGARARQRSRYDYGGNPLAHVNTGDSARFPAFGGEAQPGLYKPTTDRKFGNAAPLGLSAFALTTFVLSLINVNARGVTTPNIVVASAYAYGGLVQLLAGMWYVVTSVNPVNLSIANSHSQGNGCWKHLWCYRALIIRWILDLLCYCLDPWRFRNCGSLCDSW